MKLVIWTVLSLMLSLLSKGVFAADEDPKPLPRLDAILAAVQERAARQLEARRAQQAQESQAPQQPQAAASGQPLGLRQGTHLQEPSLEDRMNMLLEKRRSEASRPILPFVMRADGRPLGAEAFGPKSMIGGAQVRELRGSLKIDHDSEDLPEFKMYFEGMETTNNAEGFFKFPVEGDSLEKYAIIICNKIQHSFGKHNTVDSFGLIPDMNYKYFRFKRNPDGSGSWVQKEKDLRKKNLRIPSNAIVLTLNPMYFDRLENNWPGEFGNGVLKLPRIVLKAGHRAKLERKAVKSLLWGLDMSPFHANVKYASREVGDGKGEVSVPFEN